MKLFFILWMMLAISSAQTHLSPISAASAQTFGTFYRGMDAVNWNPANLAYEKKDIQVATKVDTVYRIHTLTTESEKQSDGIYVGHSITILFTNNLKEILYEDSLYVNLQSLKEDSRFNVIIDEITNHTTADFYLRLMNDKGYSNTLIDTIFQSAEQIYQVEKYKCEKEKINYLELLNLGVLIGNSSVDADWLNTNAFNSGYLNSSDKEIFLSIFPDGGWKINPLLQARFGLRLGRTAIQISPEIYGEVVIPTGLFDFALNGIRFDTPSDLSGDKTQFQAVLPIGVSTGWHLKKSFLPDYIPETYIGCGIKFLMGGAYFETEFDTLQLTSGSEVVSMQADITSTYNLGGSYLIPDLDKILSYTFDNSQTYTPGGNGYAFDIGLITNINEKWGASLAVTNLLGKIKWSRETSYKHNIKLDFSATTAEIEESNMDSLLQKSVQVDSSYHINSFTTPYPGKIIMGTEYALKNLILAANIQKGFSNEFGSSTVPRLSFASEYRPGKLLSLFAGTSFGGAESFQWGTGFSFRLLFYQLNFGFSQYGGMFNSAKGFSLSLSNSIVF